MSSTYRKVMCRDYMWHRPWIYQEINFRYLLILGSRLKSRNPFNRDSSHHHFLWSFVLIGRLDHEEFPWECQTMAATAHGCIAFQRKWGFVASSATRACKFSVRALEGFASTAQLKMRTMSAFKVVFSTISNWGALFWKLHLYFWDKNKTTHEFC
jgi:hypothetical protein